MSYAVAADFADLDMPDMGQVGVVFKQAYLAQYANTSGNKVKDDLSVYLKVPADYGTWTFEWRNYHFSNQNTYPGGHERTQEVTAQIALKDGEMMKIPQYEL